MIVRTKQVNFIARVRSSHIHTSAYGNESEILALPVEQSFLFCWLEQIFCAFVNKRTTHKRNEQNMKIKR